MKTENKNLSILLVLIAVLGLILAGRVTAQTFTTLHSFTALSGPYPGTNSDGTHPNTGGSWGANYGSVFALNTDGTGFTNLHSFTGSEGARPEAGLTLAGNILY